MNARKRPNRSGAPRRAHPRGGFSLTELLVVIGIIVLLVGLLLAALGTARGKARHSQAESTLRGFAQACETFQMEQGAYPGVIPETVLDQGNTLSNEPEWLTATENALVHLMGGYRVLSPSDSPNGQAAQDFDSFFACAGCSDLSLLCYEFGSSGWKLKVDLNRLGEGPLINGQPFAPYFTPSGASFAKADGQVGDFLCDVPGVPEPYPKQFPDLIDAWGQPVIYARRVRTVGQLAGNATTSQFTLAGTEGYLQSTGLGRIGADQLYTAANNPGGSILSNASPLSGPGDCGANNQVRDCNFWKLIEHPALGGQARGAFALFSAGDDGIFFSGKDGPVDDDGNSFTDLWMFIDQGGSPAAFDEYDDIRIFGGG